MGCLDPKEKLEDEMMKIKMARIELQMKRLNQFELLKNKYGFEKDMPVIPDYIDQKFLMKSLEKKRNSLLLNKDITINTKENGNRSKSFAIKRSSQASGIKQGILDTRKMKKRKRKTIQI